MSVAYDYKVRTTYTDDVPRLRAAHKVLLVSSGLMIRTFQNLRAVAR